MGVFGSIVTAGAVMRSRTSMADPPGRMLGFTLPRARRTGHRAQALFGRQHRLKCPWERENPRWGPDCDALQAYPAAAWRSWRGLSSTNTWWVIVTVGRNMAATEQYFS